MDLVGMVTQAAKKELLSKIAPMLGENENNVSSAVNSVIPSLIGALAGKASDEKGASDLVDFIGKNKLDNGFMDSFGSLLSGNQAKPELLEKGNGVLDFMFGKSKVGSVIDLISRFTGMKSNSSGSFMKILAPYVLGMVGNHIKKNALSPAGIAKLFLGQKDFVQKAAPAELAQGLGFANFASSSKGASCSTGSKGASCSTTSRASSASSAKASGGIGKLIPWLLLAGIAWLLFSLFGKGSGIDIDKNPIDLSKSKSMIGNMVDSAKDGVGAVAGKAVDGIQGAADGVTNAAGSVAEGVGNIAGSAVDGVKGAADMTGDMAGSAMDTMKDGMKGAAEGVGGVAGSAVDGVKNLGAVAGSAVGSLTEGIGNAFKSITLPGDIKINTPEGSFTQKMVTYLSGQEAANKIFAFDRLNFETGSARLTADSANQVNNFTQVLKAFPSVNIEVQGHTDNTGSATANKSLSQKRADAVKQALITNGIGADRLAAAGYGQDTPVADNATDEGRAQNRRVSVLVTSK